MAAIYSNEGNRWNILGFNFNKRDALSSVYKISMQFPYAIQKYTTFANFATLYFPNFLILLILVCSF
jgi:hypothetical protein